MLKDWVNYFIQNWFCKLAFFDSKSSFDAVNKWNIKLTKIKQCLAKVFNLYYLKTGRIALQEINNFCLGICLWSWFYVLSPTVDIYCSFVIISFVDSILKEPLLLGKGTEIILDYCLEFGLFPWKMTKFCHVFFQNLVRNVGNVYFKKMWNLHLCGD